MALRHSEIKNTQQMQFCLAAEINIQLTTRMSQWATFLDINFNQNSFSFATDALNLSLLGLKSIRQQLTVNHIFLSPPFTYQFINCWMKLRIESILCLGFTNHLEEFSLLWLYFFLITKTHSLTTIKESLSSF